MILFASHVVEINRGGSRRNYSQKGNQVSINDKKDLERNLAKSINELGLSHWLIFNFKRSKSQGSELQCLGCKLLSCARSCRSNICNLTAEVYVERTFNTLPYENTEFNFKTSRDQLWSRG